MRTKTCALPSVLALKVKDQRSRSDTPTFIRLIELIETANYHVNLHEILTSSFQVTDSLLIHKYENSFQGQTSRSHVTKTLKKTSTVPRNRYSHQIISISDPSFYSASARNVDRCNSYGLSVCPSVSHIPVFSPDNEDTIARFSASDRTIILVSGEVKFIGIFARERVQHPLSLAKI